MLGSALRGAGSSRRPAAVPLCRFCHTARRDAQDLASLHAVRRLWARAGQRRRTRLSVSRASPCIPGVGCGGMAGRGSDVLCVCVWHVQRCVYWEGKLFPLPGKLEDAPFFQVCPPCRPPCRPLVSLAPCVRLILSVCVRAARARMCDASACARGWTVAGRSGALALCASLSGRDGGTRVASTSLLRAPTHADAHAHARACTRVRMGTDTCSC